MSGRFSGTAHFEEDRETVRHFGVMQEANLLPLNETKKHHDTGLWPAREVLSKASNASHCMA